MNGKLARLNPTTIRQLSSTSYYISKTRSFEWMKHNDSSLQSEFKRSSFLVFADGQPLLRKLVSSSGYMVPLIPHNVLSKTAVSLGLTIDPETSAFLDVTPMQGGTNDPDDEFLPVFAINFRSSPSSSVDAKQVETAFDGKLVDVRMAMFSVTEQYSLNLLAKAQAILKWAHNTRYCTKCASPLTMKFSKASAKCSKCNKEFYPSISPVAITLITNDKNDHALLVRQPRHPRGMFTAVAGFAEIGEPIEQTVRREVAEEVGVDVATITYAGVSQPWPFPQMSLMCGFYAMVLGLPQPQIDPVELEDGRWFTRPEVTRALENAVKFQNDPASVQVDSGDGVSMVPPAGSLAHELIKNWIGGDKSKL